MRGFVRKELPLVCQKCNPAMTRRDPALRGKLLRQKCVSVGAPSCLASLSISLFFPQYIHLTLFFSPLSLLYSTISPFYPSRSSHISSPFISSRSKLHAFLTPHLLRLPPPPPPPTPPSFHCRACEEGEALLSADRSDFFSFQRRK